jgi:dipeptidyl-peptidase-4
MGFRSVFSLIVVGAVALATPTPALADGACFANLAATRNYTNGLPVKATPTPDSKAVLYLRSGPRDRIQRLFEFDLATKQERELVTPAKLPAGASENLSAEEKARRERQRITAMGFVDYELSRDGKRVLVTLGGKLYVVERPGGNVIALPGSGWLAPKFSPDGTKIAALRGGELHVIDIAAKTETQLTRGATETLTHGEAEFVAQEEMDRDDGFWWSPDSKFIAYEEADLSAVEEHYVADPLNPQAAPVKFRYPRAGTNNAKVRLGVIPVTGGATVWVPWDNQKYPYLVRVTWKDGPLTLVVMNRAINEARILKADHTSGETTILWTERDSAWLELPQANFPMWLPDGREFLWASERSGNWQLERRDVHGKLLGALTPNELRFDELLDADTGGALVAGDSDRRSRHLWFVSLILVQSVPLPERDGIHNARFGDQHAIFAHSYNLDDGSQGIDIRDRSGKLIAELPSKAEKPAIPQVEYMTVGARAFDALVVRPRNFDPNRKYPVILQEYTGPTAQVVMAAPRQSLERQCMADEGFIVMSLDNRGTPNRGRDWLRTVHRNLIDTALNDQVEGLKEIAARVPQMDMTRVGVVGWSFGGYFAAMATMRRPDVFAAGVAGAPVVDWEDYDTYYTERYMGHPRTNAEGYRKANVLTYVKDLKRPLMIVHGVTDDNVYFQHSMRLIDALLKAGKPYDLLLLPGTHMLADPTIRQRESERIMAFFKTHLGQPR